MMPNSVWNIHAQVVAATMPGMTQGMTVSERTIARPAEALVEQDAGERAEPDLEHDRDADIVDGVAEACRVTRAQHVGVVGGADKLPCASAR